MTRRSSLVAWVIAMVVGACASSSTPAPSITSASASVSAVASGVGGSASPGAPGSSAPSASEAASGSSGSSGSSAAPSGVAGAPFALTSTAFQAGGEIPPRFTCDGADVSPALSWSGVPAGAAALVLVVDDPDAGGFVHWIAYNVVPGPGGLPEATGTGAEAPPQGMNDFGKAGWGGPCPPSGDHRYRFTLQALASPLPLSGAPGADAVRAATSKSTVLATTTLEGRYRRH
jgi:Raf kinase inhibitor-like YbhB/YbcL family protein